MREKKDDGKVAAWGREPMAARLHRCRAMLVIHDLIGDKVNETIRTRIVRRYQRPLPERSQGDA